MTPVQAVLFDYGLVLSGPTLPSAWARMRTITGLNESTLHREYWAYRHDYDRGVFTGTTYWQQIASGSGIQISSSQLHDLIAADTDFWGELNLPMLHWAQALQRAGIRTGILSNMPDAMAAGLLGKHGDWLSKFDHTTWSHELKLAKPDPAIYRHAAQGLNTPPANILFVDDRPENITAALAAGMQAIQYVDHVSFVRQIHLQGLSHLLQIPSVVASS